MDIKGENLKTQKKYSRPMASHCDRSDRAFRAACFSYDFKIGTLQPDGFRTASA